MTDTARATVQVVASDAARRAQAFQLTFERRFRFALTYFTTDEHSDDAVLCTAVPRSYFKSREQWLGYVAFSEFGSVVCVTEHLPDNSYREVKTYLGYDEPGFEDRILELFQQVIDRG